MRQLIKQSKGVCQQTAGLAVSELQQAIPRYYGILRDA